MKTVSSAENLWLS